VTLESGFNLGLAYCPSFPPEIWLQHT